MDKDNQNKQEINEEVKENTEESTTAEVSEIDALKKANEELNSQVADFKDKWMRNVAEFDNYKKRNAKIWQDAFFEGETEVILKILPIGDNLERALNMGLDEKTEEGIKNLKRSFEETLKSLNVEEINPVGQEFDPNIAEAVMQVEGEEGEKTDTVKQVFEKGYKVKEKIIRYAKVSVIK